VHFCERKGSAFREAHSSGTTVAAKGGEGDGADSPTQAPKGRDAARPINFASQNLNEKLRMKN
jgi:hypothetical protein